MKKKILALLMALVLVIGMLPTTAMAAEVVTEVPTACTEVISGEVCGGELSLEKRMCDPVTADGTAQWTCTVCRATYMMLNYQGHAYVDGVCVCGATETVACTHDLTVLVEGANCQYAAYYSCACGSKSGEVGKPDPNVHTYSNGVCTGCNAAEPTCTHENTRYDIVTATCKKTGVSKVYCKDCGALVSEEVLPIDTVDGHAFLNGKCVLCGACDHEYFYACDAYCMNCGELTNEDAAHAIGHTEAVAGTDCQTWDGNVEYWYCSICGACWLDEALTQQIGRMSLAANGAHKYENGICTLCEDEDPNYVAPECEHSYVTVKEQAATCAEGGYVWTKCSKCGNEYNYETAVSTVHGETRLDIVMPTCVKEGVEKTICKVCDAVLSEKVLAADTVNGHAFYNGKCLLCGVKECAHESTRYDIVMATCVKAGVSKVICKDCGVVVSEEVLAADTVNGHAFYNDKCLLCGISAGSLCDHDYVVVKEEAATCTENGYVWKKCSICGWEKNHETYATGHSYVKYDAVEPTCDTEGNVAYEQCSACGAAQTLGENPIPLSKDGWVLGATGHSYVKHDAVEPTCLYEGNIAYEQCSICGSAQTLGENPMPLSKYGWILSPVDHEVRHVDAIAPGCHYTGNVEYWNCVSCNACWTDEALTQVSNIKNVVIPALGGEVEHFDAVEPGCYDGNIEYWTCYECEQVWQDEALTQLTNIKNVILPGTGHAFVEIEAVEPTCEFDGNIAYKRCETCGVAETMEGMRLGLYGWIQGATGHSFVEYEAVEPTCDTEGNIAYKRCETCGYAETAGENPMPLGLYGWVLGATGHSYVQHEAVAPTCDTEGNVAYEQCSVCGAAQTLGENPMPLGKDGWVLGVAHQMKHVPAVAPTCYEPGNVEHSYCELCGYTETADGKLTNILSVVLPVTHTIKHVEAKAPTATENGNIEYWYCETCGFAWLDELCTKNSNLLAVVLPATGETAPEQPAPEAPEAPEKDESPKTADVAPFMSVAVLAVMAAAVLVVLGKKRHA